jgi:hypothetical protein
LLVRPYSQISKLRLLTLKLTLLTLTTHLGAGQTKFERLFNCLFSLTSNTKNLTRRYIWWAKPKLDTICCVWLVTLPFGVRQWDASIANPYVVTPYNL